MFGFFVVVFFCKDDFESYIPQYVEMYCTSCIMP